jgi:hypothetical protein
LLASLGVFWPSSAGHSAATEPASRRRQSRHATEDRRNGLPDRILVVHEFDAPRIKNRDQIQSSRHVQLVIDMDGFGLKKAKI